MGYACTRAVPAQRGATQAAVQRLRQGSVQRLPRGRARPAAQVLQLAVAETGGLLRALSN